MRIVFPTDANEGYLSKRGAHFGKAKYYTIITLENNEIVNVEGKKNPGDSGACANAISNIMSFNPDVLIVGGIGGRPAQGFADAGLNVYFDQTSPTVKDCLEMFLAGKLAKSSGQGTCSNN